MKRVLIILALIAVAAVTAVCCHKQTPEELAIEKVQRGCIGEWTGTLPLGQQVNVSISPDFKITTTGNFSAQVFSWFYKSGTVWAELNDTNHTAISIAVSEAKMIITSNDAFIYLSLPPELNKLFK